MSKSKQPVIEVRTFTPEDCVNMLAASKRRNRKTPLSKEVEFAAKMAKNEWNPYNSQAVSRDWNGDIVNGHTRFKACIRAGVPFTTLFIDGVDPDTFQEEDTGESRKPKDFFVIAGKANFAKAGLMAAAARAIEYFDRGLWRHAAAPGAVRRMPYSVCTTEQLLEAVKRRPLVVKGANYLWENNRLVRRYPTGALAALWALTHGNPAHDAFWGELVKGLEVSKDSPVRQLRDRMTAAEDRYVRVQRTVIHALTTKVWNAYQAGEKIERLMWLKGRGERFPEPVTRVKPLYPNYGRPEPEQTEAA